MIEINNPKIQSSDELIIDSEIILPGEYNMIRINAGKIPSGKRIDVYAHVYHTGVPGPSLLVLGGIHGNEINGIEIVRRSIEEKIYSKLTRGTVIVIPLLNVYGFINFSRMVYDGKDVNRSFPGHINGSLASRVARIITRKILPFVDLALDFHTGGDARYNYPQTRFNPKDSQAAELAKLFGTKYLIEQSLIPNSFRKSASDMKIPAVVYEGGESIRLDSKAINRGIQSIKNVVSGLGMIHETEWITEENRVLIHRTSWIRASNPGLFIWSKCSGQFVEKGEKIGEIKDPFGTQSTDVIAKKSGHIIGHNNACVVSLGDALFHIGYDFSAL